MARKNRRWKKLRRLSDMQPEENAFVPRGANRRPWAVIKEDRSMKPKLSVPKIEALESAQASLDGVISVLKAGAPDESAALRLQEQLDAIADLILPEESSMSTKVTGSRNADILEVIKSLKKLSVETSTTDLNVADQVDTVISRLEGILKTDVAVDAAAAVAEAAAPATPASSSAEPSAITPPQAVTAAAEVAAVTATPATPVAPAAAPEAIAPAPASATPAVSVAETPAPVSAAAAAATPPEASTSAAPITAQAPSGTITKADLDALRLEFMGAVGLLKDEVTKIVQTSVSTPVNKRAADLPVLPPASQVPLEQPPMAAPTVAPMRLNVFDLASSPELAEMDHYGMPKAR